MRLWRRRYWHHCDDWHRPARPYPACMTTEISRRIWDIIDASPFDREALDRVLGEWSADHYGGDKAALSGAAHELELYGGER